jgi:hypothetical protein
MENPRSFGEKLTHHMEVELGRRNWRRGLAKQVAARTGQQPEHVRRMLYKWIDGGVEATEASRESITSTLGLEKGALDPEEDLSDALTRALRAAVEADPQAREALRRMVGMAS